MDDNTHAIVQITPAEGWYAVWIDFDEGMDAFNLEFHPVAYWARVEGREDGRSVLGYVVSDAHHAIEDFMAREQDYGCGYFEYVHADVLADDLRRHEIARRARHLAEMLLDPDSVPSIARDYVNGGRED